MSAQIIAALRARASALLAEAEANAWKGETPIDIGKFPRDQHPRNNVTLAMIAHEFLHLADQAEGPLTSDNSGPWCPAGQRIIRIDYSKAPKPWVTHEDGTMCSHPGPVSFGNRR